MIIRARVVVPLSQAPIDNGAVALTGNRITQVGPWREFGSVKRENVLDLGEVALLPGLINAHCHLELTGCAGAIAPGEPFVDWVRAILELKANRTHSELVDSWRRGAKQQLRHGTTTVANVESVPSLLHDKRVTTPLRLVSFIEMTGALSERPTRAILNEALQSLRSISELGHSVGLSPHAPYSTTPELLKLCSQTARDRGLPLMTHVAESRCESEMYHYRQGPLYDWLKSSRDMSDCGHGSPIRHLERYGLLQTWLLAVHANHLSPGDAHTLARHHVPVVHCPRTHAFFQRDPFPGNELLQEGVNLCLGTDSLASISCPTPEQSPELNLFEEMRQFHHNFPDMAPGSILEMVTRQGAQALGFKGKLGELATGAYADAISIPFSGPNRGVLEAILDHAGPVQDTIINGEVISLGQQ